MLREPEERNYNRTCKPIPQLSNLTAMQHSSLVDERYMVIGGHIEVSVREKIHDGEYIDFCKVITKQECLSALCDAIFKVEEVIFSIFTFLNEMGVQI